MTQEDVTTAVGATTGGLGGHVFGPPQNPKKNHLKLWAYHDKQSTKNTITRTGAEML